MLKVKLHIKLSYVCLIGLTVILNCVLAAEQMASFNSNTPIGSFTGKMNVPERGADGPRGGRGIVAYWPGLKGGNDAIFIQTCLVDEQHQWAYVDMGTDCKNGCAGPHAHCRKDSPKFCEDSYGPGIKAGDTISWYLRLSSNASSSSSATNAKISYEAGWKSEPSGKSDHVTIGATAYATHVTGILVEGGYHNKATSLKGPVQFWDMELKDVHGKVMNPKWDCKQGDSNSTHLNCNWSAGNKKGFQVTMTAK